MRILASLNPTTRAFFILLTIPCLWGMTFPLTHRVVEIYSPDLFIFWRFMFAILLLLPWMLFTLVSSKKISLAPIGFGLVLGILNSGIFLLQAASLKYLSAPRTAVLMSTMVLFVPLLSGIFGFGLPKKVDLIGAMICVFGIYILNGANITGFGYGDYLIIGSAFCAAISILVTEKASILCADTLQLTFYQIIFTIIIPCFEVGKQIIIPHDYNFWLSVSYCAIAATIIPLFLSLKYQRFVRSNVVSLIFNLESVTAVVFAWLFFHEHISRYMLLGSLIILFSVTLPALKR